jgi:pimeloyl-ACP methyl ester carboxylesterase
VRVVVRVSLLLLAVAGAVVVVGVSAQRAFERRCRERAWPGALVPTPAGPVHLWCEGEGQPIVLLEASGLGNALQYERVLPELARHTTTCAWDRPGMGQSPPGAAAGSAPAQGEQILAALAQQRIVGPLVVVGASAGGLVSLALARCHPERVVGAVLVDAVGPDAAGPLAAPFRRLEATTRRAAWAARLGWLRVLDPFHLPEPEACLTYRPSVFAAASDLLAGFGASARAVSRCGPLAGTMPLVVLRHGRVGDLVGAAASPEEQRAFEPTWVALQEGLARQSTRGQLRVVAGSGHLIVDERPDVVVQAVHDVLDTLAGARSP